MLDSNRTSATYTMTGALFAGAFIFSPAVLAVQPPFGYVSVSLALTCSTLCAGLALIEWKKNSDLTILSLAPRRLASSR
jgi:hypothetical protein